MSMEAGSLHWAGYNQKLQKTALEMSLWRGLNNIITDCTLPHKLYNKCEAQLWIASHVIAFRTVWDLYGFQRRSTSRRLESKNWLRVSAAQRTGQLRRSIERGVCWHGPSSTMPFAQSVALKWTDGSWGPKLVFLKAVMTWEYLLFCSHHLYPVIFITRYLHFDSFLTPRTHYTMISPAQSSVALLTLFVSLCKSTPTNPTITHEPIITPGPRLLAREEYDSSNFVGYYSYSAICKHFIRRTKC